MKGLENSPLLNLPPSPLPTRQAPNYFSVVTRPMDFSTLRSQLVADHYGGWDDLEADVLLMFDNCMRYNGPRSAFTKAAQVGGGPWARNTFPIALTTGICAVRSCHTLFLKWLSLPSSM